MDLEIDLEALGLGTTVPAGVAHGAGSFTSTMLTPRHGTQGTLRGEGGGR